MIRAVDEEIELATKTSGEVVAALADRAGVLAVPRAYGEYIAARIHLRHYPKLVDRAMGAAEKIKASGCPRRAFEAIDEPLLTSILEGMSEETDPSLQEAWENLLANTLTDSVSEVRRAYPRILGELEPGDARMLKLFAAIYDDRSGDQDRPLTNFGPETAREVFEGNAYTKTHGGWWPGDFGQTVRDNLVRLGLVERVPKVEDQDRVYEELGDLARALRGRVVITLLGRSFVQACQAPTPSS
jgi:hypothetical protein